MFALAVVAAVTKTLMVPRAGSRWRADAATRREMFDAMAAVEPLLRREAERAFPGDPWSADDDFHNHEQRQAWKVAFERGATLADGLRALDEGLRDHANSQPLPTTVPPCHPRPDY